jgi:ribonuclease Z
MADAPRVILLGTGGPRIDHARNAAAVLLRLPGEEVLVDAGRGVVRALDLAGADLKALRRMLLTHHHFDHIGDLYDVMLTTWLEGRRAPLRIEGPPETQRIVDALLTQVYDKDLTWRGEGEPTFGGWAPIEARDIAAGQVLRGEGWQAVAREVSHGHGLDTMSAGFLKRWTCFGYRFEVAGKVIAISGDTVDCAGLRALAQGADLLVQCCYLAAAEITSEHFRRLARHTLACGDTVGRIAAECGVKRLVLTHHRPRADGSMLEVLAEEVARDFGGEILIGRDLMEIAL